MMVQEGEALTLPLPFRVGGDLVVPDAGSVTISIYAHDGTKLVDAEPVTTPDYEISAAHHTIAANRVFEKRSFVLTFRYGGKLFTVRESYRITPFLHYSASAEDVRNFIGISAEELPDDAVDLFKAYVALRERVPAATLTAALTSGDVAEIRANDALVMLAVIDTVPSLLQRVAAMEADGILQFRRQTVKGYEALAAAAEHRLAVALSELGVVQSGTDAATMITKVTPSDPITGA